MQSSGFILDKMFILELDDNLAMDSIKKNVVMKIPGLSPDEASVIARKQMDV